MNSIEFYKNIVFMLVVCFFLSIPASGGTFISMYDGNWENPEIWWSVEGDTEIPRIPEPDDDVIVNHAILIEDATIYVRSLNVGEGGVISCIGSDMEIHTREDISIAGGSFKSSSDPNTGIGGALTLVSGRSIVIQTLGENPAILADKEIIMEAHDGISFLECTGICILSQTGPVFIQVPSEDRILTADGIELTELVGSGLIILEVLVIDDFESYTDNVELGETIWQTWIDGLEDPNNGGSQVGYPDIPFVEQLIVLSGRQSMPFSFNNTEDIIESATYRTFDPLQDWSNYGMLSLWIYGDPNNIAEADRFFVRIRDVNENIATFFHEDPNILTQPLWQNVSFSLGQFTAANVNLQNIKRFGFGVGNPVNPPVNPRKGNVRFDNIKNDMLLPCTVINTRTVESKDKDKKKQVIGPYKVADANGVYQKTFENVRNTYYSDGSITVEFEPENNKQRFFKLQCSGSCYDDIDGCAMTINKYEYDKVKKELDIDIKCSCCQNGIAPPNEKSIVVDVAGPSIGGSMIIGYKYAVEPFAKVIIRDKDLHEITVEAKWDGSFVVQESDLAKNKNFDRVNGPWKISQYQKTDSNGNRLEGPHTIVEK